MIRCVLCVLMLVSVCVSLVAEDAEDSTEFYRGLPPGPHPYLFFSADDIPKLRAKMTVSPTKELWERTKAECDKILSRPCESYPKDGYWEHVRRRGGWVEGLSFAYVMTGEKKYADRAIEEIEALVDCPYWIETHRVHKGQLTTVDRVTARVASVLAQAYDWMYDILSPELRQRIRQAAVEKAMNPLVEGGKAGKIGWLTWHRGNWCIGGLGQIGITGLAFLDEEKDAPEWIAFALRNIKQGLREGCRDGGWGEGCQYYCVGWCPASRFGKALKRATQGKADIFTHPFLKNVHQFPLYFLMPDRAHYARIGNCNVGPSHSTYFFVLLADEHKNPYAQWLAGLGIPHISGSFQTVFSIIFYDAAVQPKPPSDLPLAKHFRDLDWACFRSGWNSPDDVWFTLKGGTCDWDHIHGDGNSFTLYACGAPLIVDQGYPKEVWGCRTEAHNTIRVNEQDQYPRTNPAGGARQPEHFCDLTEFVHTNDYDHIRGDATTMYDPKDVKRATREVMYIRPDLFAIFDDVTTTAPLPVDWSVHTFGDLKIDGSTITITQDAAAVDIAVIEPDRFRTSVLSKSFKDVGIRQPFETAKADTFVKLRPVQDTDHANFLTVLMPRRAKDEGKANVSRIGDKNLLGVRIEHGGVDDIALFALDGRPIHHGDISADARSCFIRRKGTDVVFFAVHDGKSLTVGDKVLFQSDETVESKTGGTSEKKR